MLFSLQVCHNDLACSSATTAHRDKRAVAPSSTSQGVAILGVSSVSNKFVNSPPVITSNSYISIFEDEKFTFTIQAKDPDPDELSLRINSSAPATTGDVTLDIDGTLVYTPCRDCYGTDTVHFTVLERRTDDEPVLSVDGIFVVTIIGTNDVPKLQMFSKGHNIITDSPKLAITTEEYHAYNDAYKDVVYVVAANDADYNDELKIAFDQPEHGNLTKYSMVKNVEITLQNCSETWDIRRHLWDELIGTISSSDAVQKVQLPEPCDDDLAGRHVALAVTMFKYRPFEGYFGYDSIKVGLPDIIPPLHAILCRLESLHANVFCILPSQSSSDFWPYPLSPGLAISALVCLDFAFHLLSSVICFSRRHLDLAFAHVQTMSTSSL